MSKSNELFSIQSKLEDLSRGIDEFTDILDALESAAKEIGRSSSGSWLGYHSRVYYNGFVPPPPGAHFSQEWGLRDMSFTSLGSRGDWQEYDAEEVKACIYEAAGNPSLADVDKRADDTENEYDTLRDDATSIIRTDLRERSDTYLETLLSKLSGLAPASAHEFLSLWNTKGQIMSRDMIAVGQGIQPPPHIRVMAEVAQIRHTFGMCAAAAREVRKAASHILRNEGVRAERDRVGTTVFIGHGRSFAWRDLKDFIQERMRLPYDEFNRVPVAGVTNIARLSQMMDSAAIALIIMTAEDERVDGRMQARMNVVHEAGLFQGRLGFTRAILILEEGCEEFSNIQGLGQIRFPAGNISAVFEEVRRVLEREGLVEQT